MRFDLRDLEVFIAVADSGSIARAAERAHTVASAISKRISELEQNLGTPLLIRGARGVELTAAGHALLIRARALLHQARQLDEELQRHASGSAGHVRLFANISAIVEFLPSALAAFSKAYPDIHLHLEEHVSTVVAAAVADGSADLGIVSELPIIDGLQTTPFRTDELVLVVPRSHPLANEAAVRLADLAGSSFVGLHASSSLQNLLKRVAAEAGIAVHWRIHVTSFDAACAMVAAGLGISIVPRAATTAFVRSLPLVALPLADSWAARQLFLCTRVAMPLDPCARLLFEHLQQGVQ